MSARNSLLILGLVATSCAASAPPEQAPLIQSAPPGEVWRGQPFALSLEAPRDVASPPPDAQRSSSGLVSKVLRPGVGTQRPGPESTISAHYVGWTSDGVRFDSSLERERPLVIKLTYVIEGWREGVQLMVPGEVRRFWSPEQLAYRGRPGAPEGLLVFDIELLEMVEP